MAGDRAKNTLSQARLVDLGATDARVKDFVGKADQNDLYRFTLSGRSSFSLNLANIRKGANVDVELFSLKGDAKKLLRRLGKTDFSKLSRRTIRQNFTVVGRSAQVGRQEALSLAIGSGDYYLRVYSRKGDTNYSLTLAADSLVPVPAPSPSPSSVPAPSPSPSPSPSLSPLPAPAPTPNSGFTLSWIRQFGSAGNDYTYGTVTDKAGNVYVSGVTPRSGTANTDAFVAKYDSIGTQLWFRPFDISDSGAASDIGFDVAVDSAGNYYVAGATNITSTSADGFVAKYNSSGDRLWQQPVQSAVSFFGGSIPAGDAASSIALSEDAAGNVGVYVAGTWKAIPTLAPGQAFVARYNTNLGTTAATTSVAQNWIVDSQSWFTGSSGSSGAADLAIDATGSLYITGITNATLQSDITNPFTGGDAFVIKIGSSGVIQQQAVTLGSVGSGQDYARGVAVDGSGNAYITGQTDGTLPGQVSAGGRDAFVAKYDSNLNRLWVNQFGTASLDEGQAIGVDAAGSVYASGETNASLFGNAYLGGSDAWFAQFNAAGNRLNSRQVGTDRDDESYGIAIDSAGSVYLSGQTQGNLAGATNQGEYDAWIGKFLPL